MTDTPTRLPPTLALVDDDPDFSELLAGLLREQGVAADWFVDSEALLCSPQPFDYDFYVLDLMLPGVDGVSLLKLLRRRTRAGVLVVSGKLAQDAFGEVLKAGADMFLGKPATMDQVLLAIGAVYRRARPADAGDAAAAPVWRLDVSGARLLSPQDKAVTLSPTDLRVLECLLQAPDHVATRADLQQLLGLSDDDPNLLAATLYRLRRRIETATGAMAPLQTRSRVGYQFKAPLKRA